MFYFVKYVLSINFFNYYILVRLSSHWCCNPEVHLRSSVSSSGATSDKISQADERYFYCRCFRHSQLLHQVQNITSTVLLMSSRTLTDNRRFGGPQWAPDTFASMIKTTVSLRLGLFSGLFTLGAFLSSYCPIQQAVSYQHALSLSSTHQHGPFTGEKYLRKFVRLIHCEQEWGLVDHAANVCKTNCDLISSSKLEVELTYWAHYWLYI